MAKIQTQPTSNQEVDELGNIVDKNRDIMVDESEVLDATDKPPSKPHGIICHFPEGNEKGLE